MDAIPGREQRKRKDWQREDGKQDMLMIRFAVTFPPYAQLTQDFDMEICNVLFEVIFNAIST